jgi:hypothetical protein
MATKKDLNEYLTKVGKLKPSAEVKFKTTGKDGTVTEEVASRTYVAKHIGNEVDVVSQIKGLSERLNRVTEKAAKVVEDDLDDIEKEVEHEQLEEAASAAVEFSKASEYGETEESPFTHVPNSKLNPKSTEEMSELALLIKLVSKLIDKIDDMQNFNPVIHVPAPVIHVTLPETRKTVTRAVERDDEGFIKSIREHVEEVPNGEPLIEVQQEQPRRKMKPKKDSE